MIYLIYDFDYNKVILNNYLTIIFFKFINNINIKIIRKIHY